MLICVFLVILKKVLLNEPLQWRGTTYGFNRYEPTVLDPTASQTVIPENESGLPRCRQFGISEKICHHKLQKSVCLFASEKTSGSRKHYVELVSEKIDDKEQMGI